MIDESKLREAVNLLKRAETSYIPESSPMTYKQAYCLLLALAEAYLKAGKGLPEEHIYVAEYDPEIKNYKYLICKECDMLLGTDGRKLKDCPHNKIIDACRLVIARDYVSREVLNSRMDKLALLISKHAPVIFGENENELVVALKDLILKGEL